MVISERNAIYQKSAMDLVAKQTEYENGEENYKHISRKVSQLTVSVNE